MLPDSLVTFAERHVRQVNWVVANYNHLKELALQFRVFALLIGKIQYITVADKSLWKKPVNLLEDFGFIDKLFETYGNL